MKLTTKKLLALITAGLVVFLASQQHQNLSFSPSSPSADSSIAQAYAQQQSNLQISGEGTVIKLLADDNKGSRHQKFILEIEPGLSVLVAHNIDLAPRINTISRGDSVAFFGEYEWNQKGGVIHWTHHDPAGRHLDGWLKHKGQIYQ